MGLAKSQPASPIEPSKQQVVCGFIRLNCLHSNQTAHEQCSIRQYTCVPVRFLELIFGHEILRHRLRKRPSVSPRCSQVCITAVGICCEQHSGIVCVFKTSSRLITRSPWQIPCSGSADCLRTGHIADGVFSGSGLLEVGQALPGHMYGMTYATRRCVTHLEYGTNYFLA